MVRLKIDLVNSIRLKARISVWMTYKFLTQDFCGFEVVWLHGFTITTALREKKKICTIQLKNNHHQRSLLHCDPSYFFCFFPLSQLGSMLEF